MAASAYMAALHHLLFFVIVAAVTAEFILLSEPVTARSARRLAIADAHLGAAAVGILAVGFLRAVYFEKGWEYYAGNHWFHAKIGVFVLVALISVWPTAQFLKWRKATELGAPPAYGDVTKVRRVVMIELAGLAVVFTCAALMARGV